MMKFVALALAAFCLVPSTAFGAELDLTNISGFRTGRSTYVTSADGVTVTFTAYDGNSTSVLTYQRGDGFGVDSRGDLNGSTSNDRTAEGDVLITSDEINGKESIKVTF